MAIHPLAGMPAPAEVLIDIDELDRAYYNRTPELDDPLQLVSFGTSGHRGSSTDATFTEAHVLSITQAICDYRRAQGIDGPLYMGKDTHALSGPAQNTALEVLAANGVETVIQCGEGFTPTPSISHAILAWNAGAGRGAADGIVITPSHNPPSDGGFKYNPPNGGPADTDITGWIEKRANELLTAGNVGVKRSTYERALAAPTTHQKDLIRPYVNDLGAAIDMAAIRDAKLKLGVDPLGGASLHYWAPIGEKYGLDLTVVNPAVDPTFGFMHLDHDGKIRMDCSSPYAMAGLVKLKDRYSVAFGNDPDSDRHGIVTPSAGLMNPNHYLAVAIRYLLTHRAEWPTAAVVGKTLVSSSIIDRVVGSLGRTLSEVPVGFKWFAPGLFDGSCCFGGEESAGASFLRRNGTVWTTDKDGLLLNLLAAEITAVTGKEPGEHYREITSQFGAPCYQRIDAPATPEEKDALAGLSADSVKATEMAGEPNYREAHPGAGQRRAAGRAEGSTGNGWFAARPSGTEDIYKIYAESFKGDDHLAEVIAAARRIVSLALA